MYEMNFLLTPFTMVKDGEISCVYEGFEFWKSIAESMAKAAENVHQECFIVCALSANCNPLCIYLVKGQIHSVHGPDIFRIAALYGVSNVLVAHKYPKKTAIANADLRFFMDAADIALLIGIQITDYILIGGDEVIFSAKQNPDVLDKWADLEEFV